MDHLSDDMIRCFKGQANFCGSAGSPLSAAVLDAAAGPLQAAVAPLLAPWADADIATIMADAVPIRFIGGLHRLVLGGEEPELARFYPRGDQAGVADGFPSALSEVVERRSAWLARFMTSPPQTNEVRRAFALVGGFLIVAKETGRPLRCLEIGASAGLLQHWDRFRYEFGEGRGWGSADSPLVIDGEWRGGPPPLGPMTVAERRGCDIAPVDIADPESRLRLLAYIWPGQADRAERLAAAIDIARQEGLALERADAGAWVEEHLAPKAGVATVLHHSVMWQYMPEATQARVRTAIVAAGATATAESPVAWLRMEPPAPTTATMDIRLTSWPGGEERLLGHCHPHGAWVQWLGG